MQTSFRYKIHISYDGTLYGGWQKQPNSLTIQQLLEEAFEQIYHQKISFTGSGRTDAGVHALAQVAHFTLPFSLDLPKYLHAMNGVLPKDIRITHIQEVPLDFHARFSATKKIYRYRIKLHPIQSPFERLYSTFIPGPFDLEALQLATHKFIGTHDFTSFANEAHEGSAGKDAIRTIYKIDFLEEPGGFTLEFHGNGFLYKMVRNIVGTLIDIARGKTSLSEIDTIFAAKNRRFAGSVAPAKGLFLHEVIYDSDTELFTKPHSK
jgi:tRNA pseudouridine38-40 synthase